MLRCRPVPLILLPRLNHRMSSVHSAPKMTWHTRRYGLELDGLLQKRRLTKLQVGFLTIESVMGNGAKGD
jgi:hypothetical protein